MTLLATARALDDTKFLWRVRSAALALSVTKYSSGNANEKALAQSVLDYPMHQNSTLEALVANAADVNALVVVDENDTVNTDGVTDAKIAAAVATYWGPVATRRAERLLENAAVAS